MKQILGTSFFVLSLALTGNAVQAQDDCFADYKAKRISATDGQLDLHYGVIRADRALCADRDALSRHVAQRISGDGWTLLRVLSTFSQDKLEGRQSDAADYFLKY